MGESFEQLGKDIVHEAVQAPKDMVGSAMESLGVSSGKKNPKQQKQAVTPQTPEQQQMQQQDEATKQAVARAALEEISGKGKQQKEPTVWEKLQQEEEQKKESEKKLKEASAKQALPAVSTKRKRGDLYGLKAKKASAEMSRNVKQD